MWTTLIHPLATMRRSNRLVRPSAMPRRCDRCRCDTRSLASISRRMPRIWRPWESGKDTSCPSVTLRSRRERTAEYCLVRDRASQARGSPGGQGAIDEVGECRGQPADVGGAARGRAEVEDDTGARVQPGREEHYLRVVLERELQQRVGYEHAPGRDVIFR